MLRRCALVLAVVLAPTPAFAYVDPGSGMMMLQGLIALIGALIVFVRNPMASLKRLIAKIRRK
ncbi:hypothetical protein [Roseateles sp.]|uniref:hypothetical protein n=1 Tax=Roseateles sp. TaxID=1971397 RepID=UPI002F42EDC0